MASIKRRSISPQLLRHRKRRIEIARSDPKNSNCLPIFQICETSWEIFDRVFATKDPRNQRAKDRICSIRTQKPKLPPQFSKYDKRSITMELSIHLYLLCYDNFREWGLVQKKYCLSDWLWRMASLSEIRRRRTPLLYSKQKQFSNVSLQRWSIKCNLI